MHALATSHPQSGVHFAVAHAPDKNMTTGDWLGLVCLAGLVGFFAGGFFVWNLFFKREETDEDDAAEDHPDPPEHDRQPVEEPGERDS